MLLFLLNSLKMKFGEVHNHSLHQLYMKDYYANHTSVADLGFHKGGFLVNFQSHAHFLESLIAYCLLVAAGKQSDLGQLLLM